MKVAALGIVLTLSACGTAEPAKQETVDQAEAPQVTIEQAYAEARAAFEKVELPEGAPEPPVTGSCDDVYCANSQVQFEQRDWPNAWRGDYQGQRNVAFCLISGCDGAVIPDRSTGCAWRAVILATNAASATDLDAQNIEHECGAALSPVQRELAMTKSEEIVRQIEAFAR